MCSITLSLVQTSQNRQFELKRFIESLNNQEGVDLSKLQLIFVDQGDNKLLFNELNSNVEFVYIKSEKCSLSHARNIAIPYVTGNYICFPDDDCWYEPDTLNKVFAILKNEEYAGVTGKGTNEKGELTSLFPNKVSELSKKRRCAAISYTLFLKFSESVFFDENIGVGSPYNLGSGEETDYYLTLMNNYGYRIIYNPNIIIHHPKSSDTIKSDTIIKKTYSYARGAGYLFKKHHYDIMYIVKEITRPFCGIFVHLFRMKPFNAKKSFYIFKGRMEGYFFKQSN